MTEETNKASVTTLGPDVLHAMAGCYQTERGSALGWDVLAAVSALIAERDALRVDAGRYRFIRERLTQIVTVSYQKSGDWFKTVTRIDFRNSFSPPYPESVDAEIDAAIARTSPGAPK